MPSQAMERRKRSQVKVDSDYSNDPDEYVNGKKRDKAQKRLGDFE